jgi:hypothetical protein
VVRGRRRSLRRPASSPAGGLRPSRLRSRGAVERSPHPRARAEGSAPLGTLTLEILDKTGAAVGEWHLEEALLLGDRPCARDLTLRDVTIEGTAPGHNPFDYPRRPPLSPGYRLLGPHGELHGTCCDLACTSEVLDEPTEPFLETGQE